MRVDIILMILGMAAVTYIPRALPAVIIDKLRFGPKFEKFLKLIPYTAMSALVFPGVISVDAARPEIGLVGCAVAGVLAWLRMPVMVCVVAAIAADILLYIFI